MSLEYMIMIPLVAEKEKNNSGFGWLNKSSLGSSSPNLTQNLRCKKWLPPEAVVPISHQHAVSLTRLDFGLIYIYIYMYILMTFLSLSVRAMQAQMEDQDPSSPEYQRIRWDALRKSINGLINKVNVGNIKFIVPEVSDSPEFVSVETKSADITI
jgi:hypothetical protein